MFPLRDIPRPRRPLRSLCALWLVVATGGVAPYRAGAVSDPGRTPWPTARSLPALVTEDGAASVGRQLSAHGQWRLVAGMIADDPGPASRGIASLLQAAPPSAQAMLRAALRRRLLAAPVDTIALLDPVRGAPFNGAPVCASGSAAWRQRALAAIAPTHDVVHALQRIDCLGALGVAKPRGVRQR